VAYKGAPADVQAKLRRVVDVWKERCIFDKEILADLENRLAGKSSYHIIILRNDGEY
jgi:regulator of Ty1 transposition protein 103